MENSDYSKCFGVEIYFRSVGIWASCAVFDVLIDLCVPENYIGNFLIKNSDFAILFGMCHTF